ARRSPKVTMMAAKTAAKTTPMPRITEPTITAVSIQLGSLTPRSAAAARRHSELPGPRIAAAGGWAGASGPVKPGEHKPVNVFGPLERLDLSDGFGGKISDRAVRVLKEGLCPRRENVVVTVHPGLARQRVGGEHLVARPFRGRPVVSHRSHVGVAGPEELPHG